LKSEKTCFPKQELFDENNIKPKHKARATSFINTSINYTCIRLADISSKKQSKI
jgi:hypothetical protein